MNILKKIWLGFADVLGELLSRVFALVTLLLLAAFFVVVGVACFIAPQCTKALVNKVTKFLEGINDHKKSAK